MNQKPANEQEYTRKPEKEPMNQKPENEKKKQ